MADTKIDQHVSNIEIQRDIQEIIKSHDVNSIQNPALKRCVEAPISPDKIAHQAYDRMHHTHNRHR